MGPQAAVVFRDVSGPPWHISCAVERIGSDYVCRIHGGDWHVGAVALSQWRSHRAVTRSLVVNRHKEEEIAVHAAHRLCRATRSSVVAIAGIHFESLSRLGIGEITNTISDLITRAARAVRDQRLRDRTRAPGGSHARIRSQLRAVLRDIDRFTSRPLGEIVQSHCRAIAEDRAKYFGNKVRVFAPIYLSNACTNDCLYCGFRKSARFRRRKLGVEEAVAEARKLGDDGYRTIDLVAGEIPTAPFVEYICRTIEAILERTAIGRINLNLGALSRAQFARLRGAGAAGYHLYQETYDPDTYFEVHRSGPKRDMVHRLEALGRAIDAGFPSVGLGILLGLRPLREDLACLVRHAEILAGDYPHVGLGFSLPRIRAVDASCTYAIPYPVTDEQFMKAILFLRLRFPRAHLTVTTRERPEIRDRLIRLGASKISAGVSTAPGGYATIAPHATPQFQITDLRNLAAIVGVIETAGLTVAFE